MIFLALSITLAIFFGICWLTGDEDKQFCAIICTVGFIAFPICSYISHTDDLGVIRAQSHIINVYEKRIEELNVQLKAIVPEGKQTNIMLLNADSPIKGIVDSVSQANKELADARAVEAQAKVSIEKRKAGIFSFIVSFCGEK